MASELTHAIMLLIAFTVLPAPTGPTLKMFGPIARSTGRARSSTWASPPTITASVAAFAPDTPPLTGASRKCTPRWVARGSILRGVEGSTLLRSMRIIPGLVEARRPFNPLFLPAPWVVIGALLELARKGQLWVHVAATLERVAVGFSAGAVLALALGLLAGQERAVRNVVEPAVEPLRPMPPRAMLPLFIVWIGIGEGSKG